jgi:hypothetical protein
MNLATTINTVRTWFAVLLVGAALCSNAWAQGWQPVCRDGSCVAGRTTGAAAQVDWQQPAPTKTITRTAFDDSSSVDSVATRVDWQQQVLKRPEPMQPALAQRAQRARLVSNESPEAIPPGPTQFEPLAVEGAFADQGRRVRGAQPGCGCQDGEAVFGEFGGGECGDQCWTACDDCCDYGYEVFDGRGCRLLRDVSLSAGVHGFKGPLDRGANGNFGFQEGVNFAGPLGDPWGCAYQIGANFVQSNFTRSQTATIANERFTAQSRHQSFITAGIFRRELCSGLQWGVVYDYTRDNYYETYDLQQIRSEIGWVFGGCNEIGFYGAFGVSSVEQETVENRELKPVDMFTLYLRHTFENAGEGRIFGGATSYGDGLLGADLWVPLGHGFALENRFTYLIPNSKATDERPIPTSERESWGLTIQLVWYPGQNARCQQRNAYRSLFGVADNALFMVDRVRN